MNKKRTIKYENCQSIISDFCSIINSRIFVVLWQHFFNVFSPPFMAISSSINRKKSPSYR